MTNTALYTRISTLPQSIQNEIFDYVEFLMSKHIPEKNKINHPKAGCMKGTFNISADFNEPLDDFNEYIK